MSLFLDVILLLSFFENYKIDLGDIMNFTFDEAAQKIIIVAKKEMLDLKHPYVGSEHLLLAILKNSSLEITQMLNDYGILYEDFRNKLISCIGIGKKKSKWFLFTPLLRRILSKAASSVDRVHIITPYNLLMALFQVGDGVAIQILLGMNIDLFSLYNKFLSYESTVKNDDGKVLLDKFGINMNKCSLANQYSPVIGRELQVQRLIEILLRKNKNNPLLIGEAGVGKTAVVEELARKIAYGEVPFKLKDKVIYNISISNLVAGTKYRGEFEEKLNKIISELINNPNIIVFFDEFHTIVGAGGAEGAIDASNILKPYLARNEIKIIGATTSFEYSKFIEKDKAFDRRFQKVFISEPNKGEVKNILLNLIPIYEEYHLVSFPFELIDYLLTLSFNCFFKGRQPDKTIDFLDEICSYCSIKKNEFDNLRLKYESKVKEFELKKNQEIIKHNFKEALMYKKEELKYRSRYNKKESANKKSKAIVTKVDIETVLYNLNKVPKKDFFKHNKKRIKMILKKKVYTKEVLIDKFIEKICTYDYVKNKRTMSFLFVGKKGVGKTFFIDNMIEELFPTTNFIKINMLDYKTNSSFSKLVGDACDYSGNSDYLFSSVKENPFSLILIDHVENCNTFVLKQILQALKMGYIMNYKGEKIVLSKCIAFFTSTKLDSSFGFANNSSYLDSSPCSFDLVLSFDDISKNEFVLKFSKDIKNNSNYLNITKKDIFLIWDKLNYKHNGFYKLNTILEEEYGISF